MAVVNMIERYGQDVTINVLLKSGVNYFEKDITDKPFGDSGEVVSFIEGNIVYVFPISEVREYQLVFGE